MTYTNTYVIPRTVYFDWICIYPSLHGVVVNISDRQSGDIWSINFEDIYFLNSLHKFSKLLSLTWIFPLKKMDNIWKNTIKYCYCIFCIPATFRRNGFQIKRFLQILELWWIWSRSNLHSWNCSLYNSASFCKRH